MNNSLLYRVRYHLMAAVTTIIWGTTLISSKVLIQAGLSPAEILLCRFILGYVFLWIVYPRTHKIRSWHDELLFVAMGLLGGSIYFLTENTALMYTHATNVALICATVPLTTAMISHFVVKRQHISRYFIIGSAVSFAGVALVILNGNFVLNLSPIGDLLTVASVLSWSFYCVLIKLLKHEYNTLFITRNLLFYGILTILPYFAFNPIGFTADVLAKPEVCGNICYLGIVSSALCYWMWNIAMSNLGVVETNNYIYFMPLVTIITASLVLDEQITLYVMCGTALILYGLWLSNKRVVNAHK